jgi:hypothetical protein
LLLRVTRRDQRFDFFADFAAMWAPLRHRLVVTLKIAARHRAEFAGAARLDVRHR